MDPISQSEHEFKRTKVIQPRITAASRPCCPAEIGDFTHVYDEVTEANAPKMFFQRNKKDWILFSEEFQEFQEFSAYRWTAIPSCGLGDINKTFPSKVYQTIFNLPCEFNYLLAFNHEWIMNGTGINQGMTPGSQNGKRTGYAKRRWFSLIMFGR